MWLLLSGLLMMSGGAYSFGDGDGGGGSDVNPIDKASAILDVADKAVNLMSKVDGILTRKLDAHYQSVAKKPEDLFKSSALDAMKKSMGKGKQITYEKLRGFKGIEEFQPSGWKYEERSIGQAQQPDGQAEKVHAYPMGAGYMMMSGCFGSNYKKGDPCYKALRFVSRCANQIDSANFIGVGFDITKSYSSESRRKSVIQRMCQSKATFLGQDVPDNMNAYGIYDYSIKTHSFQSVSKYIQYLATKSGTRMMDSVFKQTGDSFQQAGSVASSFLFSDVGVSYGSGSSNSRKDGSKLSTSLREQMAQESLQTSNNFLAVLEADLKLYEIALDHSNPEDLSAPFLQDFMSLPTSYYLIGADIALQDFILRYGTHFVKSAKFGGKLNIFKSSKSNSAMSQDEFATASEREFSSMMSTLSSSFQQGGGKFNVLGQGGQYSSKSQEAEGEKKENSSSSMKSFGMGSQDNSRSQFIQTTVDAMGGDPQIAAAIMDFYTPAFKNLFIKWVSSIRDYPKPYDMTFGRIPELLDINANSLFKEGNPGSGCFATQLKKDKEGRYFLRKKTINDGRNRTITTTEKVYCKYGGDKVKFMADFKAKRLALERAITVYMAEGPFSVSNFELKAGSKGCETETIDFLGSGLKQSRTWPNWQQMTQLTFKVIFQLPFDLTYMKRNIELEVRYNDGLWFTKMPGGRFTIDNSCPAASGLPRKNRVCVAGLNLLYNERHGYFKLDKEFYKREKTTYEAKVSRATRNSYIARTEASNILKTLEENKIGEVPCNVKWSNAHRINPDQNTSCIHFSAASKGDIFVIFSSIPRDYNTWFYLQMSPSGIAFYRAMKLEKIDNIRSSGTLGDASLFETFFVCISQGTNKDLRIMYGKAPAQREVGIVHAAFTYPLSNKDRVSFYTFGSGEQKVTIDDVRIINDKPELNCVGDLIKIDGSCVLDCHKECKGCHQAKDPRSCTSCKNVRQYYTKEKFMCLNQCPRGYESLDNVCVRCKVGHYKQSKGNQKCKKCPAGSYQSKIGSQECLKCDKGRHQPEQGKAACLQCKKGHYQDRKGQLTCKQCLKGNYQNVQGRSYCIKCNKGWHQDNEGKSFCIKCKIGNHQGKKGMANCMQCARGYYQNKKGMPTCVKCGKGQYQDKKGESSCIKCKPGWYQDKNAMTNCKPCRQGYFQNKNGMPRCLKCQKGNYQYKKGESSCIKCKKGWYQPSEGMTNCIQCERGYHQDNVGQSKCKRCHKGYYQDNKGKQTCKICPKGHHQDKLSQTKCHPCAKGFYQFKEGQHTCLECEKGYKCPSEGLKRYIECGINEYQDRTGQTFCKKCPKGESSQRGSASCKNSCRRGTYLKLGKGCLKCAHGYYAAAIGMDICKACKRGYLASRDRTVCNVDINECLSRNGGCDGNAYCINTDGSRKCECKSGFRGNGITCRDIDDCKENWGGCHNEAYCKNTIGSRECTCKEGYNGNGVTCHDINECQRKNGGCHKNADCSNTVGSRSCSCKSGYEGNGFSCSDVNECKANNGKCHKNAYCRNTIGSRTCTCKGGFQGTGAILCADINECHDGKNGGCHKNADCSNTVGSRSCSCKSGYKGNGFSCSDVDECKASNGRCHKNAYCTNTIGSRTCKCKGGYRGDGLHVCDNFNECHRDNGGCHSEADCKDTVGSRTCTCKSGYVGNGFSCIGTVKYAGGTALKYYSTYRAKFYGFGRPSSLRLTTNGCLCGRRGCTCASSLVDCMGRCRSRTGYYNPQAQARISPIISFTGFTYQHNSRYGCQCIQGSGFQKDANLLYYTF